MSHLLVSIFESFLGPAKKHNEDTGQLSFDCPECSSAKNMLNGDGKGNLEINYNLNKFRCWACHDINNMHGSVMRLLRKYATPKNIRDYLLIKPDADVFKEKTHNDIILTLPEGYKKLSECTSKDYLYDVAINYLYERGISDKIIEKFNIGYTTVGDHKYRIIIPSYDKNGILNYFIARWFLKKKTKNKYINPEAEKETIIFNENLINVDATIYLVEGAFDHIVIPNSIPLLGKYLNPKLLEFLHDNAKANIVIVLDDDAKLDALTLYMALNFGDLRDRIKICFPPIGYDPSLIYEKLGNKGIVKLLRASRKPTTKEIDSVQFK